MYLSLMRNCISPCPLLQLELLFLLSPSIKSQQILMILFSQMRENIRQKYGIEKPTGKVSTEKKLWFVSVSQKRTILFIVVHMDLFHSDPTVILKP